MIATLLTLGGLVPLISAEFPARVLSVDDGVITGRFSDSLLLSLPSCELAGQSVDLVYLNANTNENKTLISIFTVPNCSNNVTSSGPTALSRNIGYQLTNLTSGTEYKLHYIVGPVSSSPIMATTRALADYNGINDGLPARSGAMVVITVILSIAIFLLLLGLIVSTVLSSGSD